jgi:hypothetical protein
MHSKAADPKEYTVEEAFIINLRKNKVAWPDVQTKYNNEFKKTLSIAALQMKRFRAEQKSGGWNESEVFFDF